MTETRFPVLGAVYKDETPVKAEGYCVDSDNVRIKGDGWQTQYGTQKMSGTTFTGYVRGSTAWADAASSVLCAFGTQSNLYTFYGGAIYDITPEKARGTLVYDASTALHPFTTTNGSAVVGVWHVDHGLIDGDVITYSNADAVGGITLDGAYDAVTVVDPDRYTVTHTSSATSSASGGGQIEYSVPFDDGLLDGLGGTGYGTGIYSAGVYGVSVPTSSFDARIWTMSAYGSNGLFCPRDGPVYEWQPRQDYTTEHVTNGTFATDTDWTKGTGWTIGSGVATATAGTESRLEQDTIGVTSGGVMYRVVFTTTVTAGSVEFFVDTIVSGTEEILGAPVAKTGTYTRYVRFPPSPINIGFKKDASFAGTIDNVACTVVSVAYRLASAPPYCRGMVVDNTKCVIAWGCTRQDGVYDQLAVRNTPPGDSATWLSSVSNLAGENSDFGGASKIVRVLPTAKVNIVFTDTGLHLMQFTGVVGDAYSYTPIGGGAGLIGTLACAENAGRVFWYGSDNQFYIWQGGSAQLINCDVRRDMADNMDTAQHEKIYCSVDPEYSEVRWAYPDKRDGNEVSRAVVFNWVSNKWYVDLDTYTSKITKGVFKETIGFGTDSTAWYLDTGDSDNGEVRTSSLTTAKYDLGDGHFQQYLRRFIPDFDDQVGNISLTVYSQYEHNGTEYTHGPYTVTPTTKKLDFRIKAKRFWLKFDTSAAGTFWRMGSFRMDINQTGANR